MNKYIAIAKIRLIDVLNYRAELILWQIIDMAPMLIMIFVWLAMARDTIGSFTLPEIITYYLLSLSISRLIGYHFAQWRSNEIRTGEFSKFLIKPMHYIRLEFVNSVTESLFKNLFFLLPVVLVLWILFKQFIVIPQVMNLLLFLFLVFLANLISFTIQMILLCCAFFFKTIDGIKHAQWMFESILGGAMIPLTFLPSWLQTISQWLPFKLFYYFPISLYLGQVNKYDMFINLLQALIWLLIMWAIVFILWKKGLQKYSSVGG